MKILKLNRSKFILLVFFLLCIVIIGASFSTAAADSEVPYPEGFRSWTHVKTALIQKGNPGFAHWGGFHHIYGNAIAIEGYKSGKFNNGAVLVFDVLEANSKDSLVSEGKRRLVDVMVRDTGRFKATGGWGYDEFVGDSKTERDQSIPAVACYNCHARQKVNDNVFSHLRN